MPFIIRDVQGKAIWCTSSKYSAQTAVQRFSRSAHTVDYYIDKALKESSEQNPQPVRTYTLDKFMPAKQYFLKNGLYQNHTDFRIHNPRDLPYIQMDFSVLKDGTIFYINQIWHTYKKLNDTDYVDWRDNLYQNKLGEPLEVFNMEEW